MENNKLQSAFEAMNPESENELEFINNVENKPTKLPLKQFLESKKAEHEEIAKNQIMFENINPITTKEQLSELIKPLIEEEFVLYERGNLKYDAKQRTREARTYNHKLFFAKFKNEVPIEQVAKVRGIQIDNRTIFARRCDEQLDVNKSAFVRGIRGNSNIQNVVNAVNRYVEKYDPELHIDDIKMVYEDRKLRGFIYIEFNKKMSTFVGDRIYMKSFDVDGYEIQIKKYVSAKKVQKEKRVSELVSRKRQQRPQNGIVKSTLAKRMIKGREKHE